MNKNRVSSDMRSVPDLKICTLIHQLACAEMTLTHNDDNQA